MRLQWTLPEGLKSCSISGDNFDLLLTNWSFNIWSMPYWADATMMSNFDVVCQLFRYLVSNSNIHRQILMSTIENHHLKMHWPNHKVVHANVLFNPMQVSLFPADFYLRQILCINWWLTSKFELVYVKFWRRRCVPLECWAKEDFGPIQMFSGLCLE